MVSVHKACIFSLSHHFSAPVLGGMGKAECPPGLPCLAEEMSTFLNSPDCGVFYGIRRWGEVGGRERGSRPRRIEEPLEHLLEGMELEVLEDF